jgi:hypothetical protein
LHAVVVFDRLHSVRLRVGAAHWDAAVGAPSGIDVQQEPLPDVAGLLVVVAGSAAPDVCLRVGGADWPAVGRTAGHVVIR